MIKMSDIDFTITPVEEKEIRGYRKGSKYDPILDQFIESKQSLVHVAVVGKVPNYVRTQLNKRIESRKLTGVVVSVVNNTVYLETKTE